MFSLQISSTFNNKIVNLLSFIFFTCIGIKLLHLIVTFYLKPIQANFYCNYLHCCLDCLESSFTKELICVHNHFVKKELNRLSFLNKEHFLFLNNFKTVLI